ncbi:hypothetical protein M758_UG075800 [Ceratodon purpureus]|nr:hypothetical protein M758_UG075800 [Ceratodon purpureus]
MKFHGVKIMLWHLVTCTALLVSAASAQVVSGEDISPSKEGGSEAYYNKNSETTLYSSYNFLKCTSDLHVTPEST